jgi:hypothetical protein
MNLNNNELLLKKINELKNTVHELKSNLQTISNVTNTNTNSNNTNSHNNITNNTNNNVIINFGKENVSELLTPNEIQKMHI